MTHRSALTLAVAGWLATLAPAAAGSYSCNLPRALLCENCSRDLTIALLPNGACRVSFTTGAPATADAQRTTLRFAVVTPAARAWRPRIAAKPVAHSNPAAGHCFAFNGSQYCE